MTTATRLPTDMSGWMPVARHYAVEGGHLAVVVARFFTATGTEVFYCEEDGGALSTEAIARFPDGTTHNQALEQLGYTVIDDLGDGDMALSEPLNDEQAMQSVMEILPEPIAAAIAAAEATGTITPSGATGASGG